MQILRKVLKGVADAKDLRVGKDKFKVMLISSILLNLYKYNINKYPGMTLPKQTPGLPVPFRQLILKRIGLIDFLLAYLDEINKKREPERVMNNLNI